MKYTSSILLILIFVSSCKVSNKATEGKIYAGKQPVIAATNIVKGNASLVSLSPSKSDTSKLNIDYMYYSFEASAHLLYQDSINQRIADFIRTNTEFETDSTEMTTLNGDFFRSQLAIFDSLSLVEAQLSESELLWEMDCAVTITEFTNYVELHLRNWNFTGGAHGNAYEGYSLFEYDMGSVLKLSDVIQDIPTFTELAEKYFRAQNNITPTEDLGAIGFWFPDNEFMCNENFYFTGDAMHFLYNNYEIAPYSAGQITFSIPLSEVKPFLKIQL